MIIMSFSTMSSSTLTFHQHNKGHVVAIITTQHPDDCGFPDKCNCSDLTILTKHRKDVSLVPKITGQTIDWHKTHPQFDFNCTTTLIAFKNRTNGIATSSVLDLVFVRTLGDDICALIDKFSHRINSP